MVPNRPVSHTSNDSALATVTAWTATLFSALAVAILGLAGILIAVARSNSDLRAAWVELRADATVPPVLLRAVEQLPALVAGLLVASTIALVVSIGFLQRRSWARMPFLAGLAMTALAHVVGPIVLWVSARDWAPPSLPGRPDLAPLFRAALQVNLVVGIAFAVFLGWLTWKLGATRQGIEPSRQNAMELP